MLKLRNRTRGASKVGYLVKAVRGGFVYAGAGDTPIGVVTEIVPSGEFCQIQTEGRAKVYTGETITAGVELRTPIAGAGNISGQVYNIGDASEYISVGHATGFGRGLIEISLNIRGGSTAGTSGSGLPAGGAINQVLAKASAADYDVVWADALLDAPADGTGYIRSDASWVTSALLLDYTGGTGSLYESVKYGEALTFSTGGTGLAVNYTKTQVGPVGFEVWTHNFQFTYTPLGNYYDGFYPAADSNVSSSPILVGSGTTFTFAGGDYLNTEYSLSTPDQTVTFNVDYSAMNTAGLFYSKSEVDGLIGNFILDAASDNIGYARRNANWVNSGLIIDYSGGTGSATTIVNYGERITFVGAGGFVSTGYQFIGSPGSGVHEIEIDVSGFTTYDWWDLHVDGVSEVHVDNQADVNFAAGNGINLAFSDPGSPPLNTITFSVDFSGVVLTTTNQTVAGEKTFSNISYFGAGIDVTGNVDMTGRMKSTGGAVLVYSPTATTTRITINPGSASVATLYYYDEVATIFRDLRLGENAVNTGIYWDSSLKRCGIQDDTPSYTLDVNGTGRFVNSLISNSEVTAYSSDGRLKKNVRGIKRALDTICSLDGVWFDWKDNVSELGFVPTHKTETGFIAQNFGQHIPHGAVPAPFDHDGDGRSISGEHFLTVKPEKAIPYLVEAIKELNAKIEELKHGPARY